MRFGPYHLARLRGVAQCLAREGVEVHGIEVADSDLYGWKRADGTDGFERHCLFPGQNYATLAPADIRRAVVAKLDELKPEAVGINGWSVAEARAALSWCKRNSAVAILFSETHAAESRRVWWKETVKGLTVRRFDAALVGGCIHAEYAARLGIPSEKIFTGYDAVDNEYFAVESSKIRAMAAVGGRSAFPQVLHAPFFLSNTRLIRRKNIHGLLEAYAAYRKTSAAPWNLVVTGSGEEEAALKGLCSDFGIEQHVVWPGFVQYDELPLYYGLANAFVHPALVEPWGLVLNEACASSLPVLSSNTVGAASELVEDGRNGLLFDPCSAGSMSEALARIAGMSDMERIAMGAHSRRIVSDWGPERFGRSFMAAIQAGRKKSG